MPLFEFEGRQPEVSPAAWVQTNPALYLELAQRHAVSVRPVGR